jgi:hypothetical protein
VIASQGVAQSDPDGHSVLFGTLGNLVAEPPPTEAFHEMNFGARRTLRSGVIYHCNAAGSMALQRGEA